MSLAVKYRPHKLDEVVEQSLTVKILQKQLEKENFRNVYLFVGNSGCGKTTLARCFAKAINKNENFEAIEIDAASNNGVDQVRTIVESASKRDLVGEYKVFILDEVHMFSSAAWNALLKTIEEPPKYTIFILCTTEVSKVPATIQNRAQRFTITSISQDAIKNRLMYVCECEHYTNYELACDYISKMSHGSLREALSNLEKVADFSVDLSIENVKTVLGNLSYETMFKLTWALTQNKEDDLFNVFSDLEREGQDLKQFIDSYIDFVLDLIKYSIFKDISLTSIPEYLATKENSVVQFTTDFENSLSYFNKLVETLLEIKLAIKYDNSYKSTIFINLLKMLRA